MLEHQAAGFRTDWFFLGFLSRFDFLDPLVVDLDYFPSVQHTKQKRMVLILHHRDPLEVADRKFLQDFVQVFGRRGEDDLGCGNILHSHHFTDLLVKENTAYVIDGEDTREFLLCIHNGKIVELA